MASDGEEGVVVAYKTKKSDSWSISIFSMYMFDSQLNSEDGQTDQKKETLDQANAAARTVYNAVNTALVDMDTVDHDISYLKGEYTFKGTDFVGVKEPKTFDSEDDIKQELRRVSAKYFDGFAEIPEIQLYFENGICVAAAVKTKGDLIGCYPKKNTPDSDITMDDALDYIRE